jgi:hypothetical protein
MKTAFCTGYLHKTADTDRDKQVSLQLQPQLGTLAPTTTFQGQSDQRLQRLMSGAYLDKKDPTRQQLDQKFGIQTQTSFWNHLLLGIGRLLGVKK